MMSVGILYNVYFLRLSLTPPRNFDLPIRLNASRSVSNSMHLHAKCSTPVHFYPLIQYTGDYGMLDIRLSNAHLFIRFNHSEYVL